MGLGKASDIGDAPYYKKANALISTDFRYFGKNGDANWKHTSPELKKLVENLGQGHRVPITEALEGELLRLKAEKWQGASQEKVLGTPLHSQTSTPEAESETELVAELCDRKCVVRKAGRKARCTRQPHCA